MIFRGKYESERSKVGILSKINGILNMHEMDKCNRRLVRKTIAVLFFVGIFCDCLLPSLPRKSIQSKTQRSTVQTSLFSEISNSRIQRSTRKAGNREKLENVSYPESCPGVLSLTS